MDSLRETPDNIPNRELITRYLGRPLTEVPDPFEEYESFATHNNARLRKLLDGFGYDYEFASSTAFYKSGRFDAALRLMLRRFEAVQEIMQPSLREEHAATYSPFLPIHPRTRVVMQVPFIGVDPDKGTIRWKDFATGEEFETPVTGGRCKLQWKPDWAMRWYALSVDYEMAGKDLIDSVKLSSQIAALWGPSRPSASTTSSSSMRRGRRFQSRRATASASRSGSPTRVRKACRSSCSSGRRRRNGFISTLSRARSMIISTSSTPIRVRNGRSGSARRRARRLSARAFPTSSST
jgi:hypothetical protein